MAFSTYVNINLLCKRQLTQLDSKRSTLIACHKPVLLRHNHEQNILFHELEKVVTTKRE